MTIKPEKSEAGADKGRTDNRQLTGKRIKRDLQIFRDAKISSRIRKERISKRDRHGASDRETIEPVGQVNGIRRTNDDEREKKKSKQAHVSDNGCFKEWQIKRTHLHFEKGTGKKNSGVNQRQKA